MKEPAFQDQIPDNFCYGCGPENDQGLRLKSFWEGAEAVATFQPQGFHCAGPRQFLNGGIIATIIDCHCIGTAIADAYRREKRVVGTEPHIWCVTASLKVDYLQPVPIDQLVRLRAKIIESDKRKTRLTCSLFSGDRECARGEVLVVRVPSGWSG